MSTALDKLRARLADGPPLLTIGEHSQPHPDIVLLRRCLRAIGFGPGVWDNMPDEALMSASPTLLDAVEQYQNSRRIMADGICGNQTWGTLGEEGTPVPAGPPLIDQLPQVWLDEATRHVGEHEDPPGSNSGPMIDHWLTLAGVDIKLPADDKSWCAAFAHGTLHDSCAKLGVPVPFRIGASVPDLFKRAQEAGRIVLWNEVRAGCTLWLWQERPGHYGHVELCIGPATAKFVKTVGGNTSPGPGIDPNGGGVYLKTRPVTGNAFVRII